MRFNCNSVNLSQVPHFEPLRSNPRDSPLRTSFSDSDFGSNGNTSFNLNITFEAEEDDDGFEDVVLNDSILQFLKDDGASLAQQQHEMKKYSKASKRNTDGPSCSKFPTLPFSFTSDNTMMSPWATTSTATSTPEDAKPIKARRISIQNDVSPIRNKESPPDPVPAPNQTTTMTTTKLHRQATQEKWIVSNQLKNGTVPKTNGTNGSVSNGGTRKRGRPPGSGSGKKRASTVVQSEDEVKVRVTRAGSKRSSPEVEVNSASNHVPAALPLKRKRKSIDHYREDDIDDDEEDEEREVTFVKPKINSASAAMVKVAAMKSQRSRPSKGKQTRRVRARCDTQSWDWAQVLLSNPEKILRKK